MEHSECTAPSGRWFDGKFCGSDIGRILAYSLGFFFIVLLPSCGGEKVDTATSGKISIGVDEAFQPLIQAEIDAFSASYKYATVKPVYTSEDKAVQLLLADSVRSVIMTRSLTDKEKQYFDAKKLFPKTLKIATEAVAFVVNKKNPDSLLTMNRLRTILSGDTKVWNEVSGKGSQKNVVVVFDNANSSNLTYIRKKFGLGSDLEKRIYSAQSSRNVVDYVQKNENAIGVIGASWISDSDDPQQQQFKRDVTIVSIAAKDDPTIDDYFQPYAAYLQTKQYPLHRDLYIVSREARVGLGTGFAAYVASDKGQLIILKAGLLPATMPVRLIELK